MSDEKQISEWLTKDGWKEGQASIDGCDRIWHKLLDGEPMCKCNEPAPLQVTCSMYRRSTGIGIQLEICGQPEEVHEWIKFQAYCIDKVEDIPRHVGRLLTAWRAVAGDSR